MFAFYSKIVANYWDAAIQNQKRGLLQHSTPFLYIETATVQFNYDAKYISRDALSGSDPFRTSVMAVTHFKIVSNDLLYIPITTLFERYLIKYLSIINV